MPKQDVQLTETHADFIRENVEAGDYRDASEVIRAGLRLLQESQREQVRRENELRRILVAAEDSGISELSPREVWASVESRYTDRDA